ncbi:DUF4349 domain-containing protein [Paenibacillus sp. GYB003]|uniref:DUF4349 domain-containing protein n=1 Tax=Paenibacillus sp. GYB003 TaxID=2994392 RepID=UPI002F9665EE
MAKGTNRKRTAAAAASLLIVLALAGCGGSNDKASVGESLPAPQAGTAADAARSGELANASSQTRESGSATPSDKVASGAGAGAAAQMAPVSATATAGTSVQRQIMYKANVTMEVADFGSANTEINNRIHLAGGYLLQFSENRTDYEQSGTLVVKVPANGFSAFLADLEGMKPKSIQRSVQGQDVSEEFVDLEARLKSKQTEEARLLDFMAKATKSDELVAFSSQIGSVQTQIEQIKGRMRYLEQNVAYSTVEIRLYQKIEKAKVDAEKPDAAFGAKLAKALNGSAGVVFGFFQGLLIVLAGALPVLAVLAVIGIPLYFVYKARRRRMKEMEERAKQLRRQNAAAAETAAEPLPPGAE